MYLFKYLLLSTFLLLLLSCNKNLTEEDGFTVGYDVFAGAAWSYAMARKPRVWGVSVTQSF